MAFKMRRSGGGNSFPFKHTEHEAGYPHVNPHKDNVIHSWITDEQRTEMESRRAQREEDEKKEKESDNIRLAEKVGDRLSKSATITVVEEDERTRKEKREDRKSGRKSRKQARKTARNNG